MADERWLHLVVEHHIDKFKAGRDNKPVLVYSGGLPARLFRRSARCSEGAWGGQHLHSLDVLDHCAQEAGLVQLAIDLDEGAQVVKAARSQNLRQPRSRPGGCKPHQCTAQRTPC